jgi:hypothetical protein
VVEPIADLPPGTLGFRASGTITRDEYKERILAPIRQALEAGGRLNILFVMSGDLGFELGALWEDLKAAGSLGLEHRSSWGRMGVVSGKDWVRQAVAAFGWLTPGEIRVFDPDATDAATEWLAAAP